MVDSVSKTMLLLVICFDLSHYISFQLIFDIATIVHLKYVVPSWMPLCFPRMGSSHSTPNHVPDLFETAPIYRAVHSCPLRDKRLLS